MRKLLAFSLVLGLFSCSSVLAVFHDYGIPAGQRALSYFLMHQLSYSYQSSALNLDLGMGGENRSLEISLMGYRSSYILTNSVYQLGVLGKQKVMEGGNLSYTGVIGLGGLYSSTAGFSLCANLGGILGFNLTPDLKISSPTIVSVFSDGILLDYSGGISYKPPFLGGKEIILGGKGVLLAIKTEELMGMQNSFYALLGLRTTL